MANRPDPPESERRQSDLLNHLPEQDKTPSHTAWAARVRRLGKWNRAKVARHLLSLDAQDRYLRFGYQANDEQIQIYTDRLDFSQDAVFGIYDSELTLVAVAHLAHSVDASLDACAEFGVSVLPAVRGRGYGRKLFERAVRHARNQGVQLLFIHALRENTPMLTIARRGGATVHFDGVEARAYLRLPEATFDSRMSEMFEEQIAQTDYRLKRQARQFWDLLSGLQEMRREIGEGRHKSAP